MVQRRGAALRWAGISLGSLLWLCVPGFAQQTDAPAAPPAKKQARPPAGQGQPVPHPPTPASPAEATPPDKPPDTPTAKPDAAADNPFPEDVSRGAAANGAAANGAAADTPDAPAAGSSSSSSSSGGSGTAAGSDPNAEPDVPAQQHRRRLGKPSPKDIQSGSLAGEGRAEEDVRVGRYYLSQHNYQGAYIRFEEAARLDPSSVEAIYGVAAAAEGLHKTDEAKENYELYLQIAPDGEHARAAEKSLKSLPDRAQH